MTENKLWKIIDEEFISYTGGTAYMISNGDCKFHVWENEEDAQKVCDMLNEFNDENEQLKETIDDLTLNDKETIIEMEHINNIYTEFGFKGVIDYAKDQLSEYGAVIEVDKCLWLLATGGWSDHEHWLHCLRDWSVMYARGHYRAVTTGGGYYYSEEPYADIKVVLND